MTADSIAPQQRTGTRLPTPLLELDDVVRQQVWMSRGPFAMTEAIIGGARATLARRSQHQSCRVISVNRPSPLSLGNGWFLGGEAADE
jgi:hypothetical protein